MRRSGLVACWEGPRGLRAQSGFRSWGSRLLGCRSRCSRGRLGGRLFGCSLFGGRLLGCRSLFGWCSFLHCCLLGRCSLLHCCLFGRSGLLGGCCLLGRCSLLHCCLLSGSSFLHSSLLGWGSFLGCYLFRSCHTYLLDQVAKSTVLRCAAQRSIAQHPLGSECGAMNGLCRVDMFRVDAFATCGKVINPRTVRHPTGIR